MMLPEHVERIQEYRRERLRREKPALDEQALEEIARIIAESTQTGEDISVRVFDPFEDIEVTGHVARIDHYQRRFLLVHGGQRTWVSFSDVIGVNQR
jgi:hypothetical protein